MTKQCVYKINRYNLFLPILSILMRRKKIILHSPSFGNSLFRINTILLTEVTSTSGKIKCTGRRTYLRLQSRQRIGKRSEFETVPTSPWLSTKKSLLIVTQIVDRVSRILSPTDLPLSRDGILVPIHVSFLLGNQS